MKNFLSSLTPFLVLGRVLKSNDDNTFIYFRKDHVKKVTKLFTGPCVFELYEKIIAVETLSIC